jgi:hypothetical protein
MGASPALGSASDRPGSSTPSALDAVAAAKSKARGVAIMKRQRSKPVFNKRPSIDHDLSASPHATTASAAAAIAAITGAAAMQKNTKKAKLKDQADSAIGMEPSKYEVIELD